LFKQILLNPLSHDSFSTTVYQNELHRMLEHVIPEMQKMRRKEVELLRPTEPTHVYLTDEDSTGAQYSYTIELHENLWQYTFPDGSTAYSHPACQVTERISLSDRKREIFTTAQGQCNDLTDAYRKIRYFLDKQGDPIPKKALVDVVTNF